MLHFFLSNIKHSSSSSLLALSAMRCNFVVRLLSFLCTMPVSLQSCCYCDGLSSREITLFHRYYATIRLPKLRQLSLLYYRLFNLLSFLERHLRISRVANLSFYTACHALQPRSSSMILVSRIIQ